MINPDKDRRTARSLLKQEKRKIGPKIDGVVNESDFTSLFIDLERQVREYLVQRQLVYNDSSRFAYIPFRQMIDNLYRSELINRELRDRALEVNRYRNLVFHGHVNTVDSDMYDVLRDVREKILEVINRVSR